MEKYYIDRPVIGVGLVGHIIHSTNYVDRKYVAAWSNHTVLEKKLTNVFQWYMYLADHTKWITRIDKVDPI